MFTPEISVIGGVRVDRYTRDLYRRHGGHHGHRAADHDRALAQHPGQSARRLVWEPSEDQTYYFSYGKSSVPQGTSVVGSPTPITTANQALDPELSETLEIGAKKSFFDGALGLSGSLFKVLKSNALITDPVSGTATAQSGERDRVQGLELSATGQITDKWNVLGAYTFLDSKVTSDNFCTTTAPLVCMPNPYTIGTQVIFVPKNAASFWTSYKLDDFVPGLGLGGGAGLSVQALCAEHHRRHRARGHRAFSRIAVIPRPWNSMRWRPTTSSRYHFQFNVNNLTDELNYTQSFGNRGTPSAGRTFIFSVGVNL